MQSYNECPPDSKIEKFIQEFEKGGVRLQESPRYTKAGPSDKIRMDRPWRIDND